MIRQLFKQWSNLAPTECTRRETSVFDSDVYTVNGTMFFVNDTDIICFMPGEAEMWLERALQRAIKARGWDYRLETYVMEYERRYVAWVYPGGQGLGQATEAEALLAAYVGAAGAE